MARNVIPFLLLCYLAFVFGNKWDCADYYWRDYYGTIPYDAVPAGRDHLGNYRYIGVVYIRGYEYLPATILPQQGVAQTAAYDKVLTTSQYVKILCSPFREAFEWIHARNEDFLDYADRLLIPGGSEVGESICIGRVFENGDVIVGKLFKNQKPVPGIGYPVNNTVKNVDTYEVLSYNCYRKNAPKFNVKTGLKKSDTEIIY